MNSLFLLASAFAAFVAGLHVVLGGRETARPLLATDSLADIAKFTSYYCWHLVSIVLAALAAGFAWAAFHPQEMGLAYGLTALAAMFALLSIAMVARFRLSPWLLPQWLLFAGLAALGAIGIATA